MTSSQPDPYFDGEEEQLPLNINNMDGTCSKQNDNHHHHHNSSSGGDNNKRRSNGTVNVGSSRFQRTKSEEAGVSNRESATIGNLSTSEQHKLLSQIAKLQARLYAVAAIAGAGIIILIITIVVLFTTFHSKLVHHTHTPKLGTQMSAIMQAGLCVPCSYFRLGPKSNTAMESLLDEFKDETGGQDHCCADEPHKLFHMLKMYIDKQFELELAKGTVPGIWQNPVSVTPYKTAAAHLLIGMKDANRRDKMGRQQMIARWLSDVDMAFLAGGIEYDRGHIVVPHDGHYYVYSQISFIEKYKRNEAYDSSGSQNILSIYLYRYNSLYQKGGEEKLAQNSKTKCQTQGRGLEEYTISLGAVFHLRRKDKLLIKVSNISMVYDNAKSSFFGIFKI